MSEIEKLYKLADAKPYKICNSCTDDNGNKITNSKNCSFRNLCGNACDEPHYILTAEKQIELIKWLIRKYKDISVQHQLNLFYINIRDIYTGMVHIEFDETIAGLINNLWQSLTEEEKQQVKGILE